MRRELEICNASAILKVSGKLNLFMNFNRVPLIVLGFFNFHFPIDFIGVSSGVSKGSVGGQCFVETPEKYQILICSPESLYEDAMEHVYRFLLQCGKLF